METGLGKQQNNNIIDKSLSFVDISILYSYISDVYLCFFFFTFVIKLIQLSNHDL